MKDSKNFVNICGVLLENKLEEKVSNKDGKTFIGGSLVIGVPIINGNGDFKFDREQMEELEVNAFSFQLKKDGTPNKIFKSLETVMNLPSLASTGDIKESALITTRASIQENLFVGRDGNVVETVKLTSNFFKRTTIDKFAPQVKINATGTVMKMDEEFDAEGMETGRLLISIGTYNDYFKSIGLVKFILEKPEGVNFVQQNWEIGDSIELVGSIRRRVVKTKRVQEMGFGEADVQEFESVKTEYIMDSASMPLDEENEFFLPAEAVQAALNVRKERIEAIKQQASETSAPSANNASAFDF